jgi:hypothetical protein
MTDRLTKTQAEALSYYAQPAGRAPAVSTTRALLRRGLVRERQATDAEKQAIGRAADQPWRITELTEFGQLMID